MTYPEILAHIFQSFPMYHRIGSAAYKEGLENIEQLAHMAGNPEKKFNTIHIAGTNGKGSVAHLLSSYFQELGYKTGLFTSPHLVDFRERIKINGKEISEQKVVDFFTKYEKELAKIEPSFFEVTTILSFDYFASEAVDLAIIEVGLGGRLDATNLLSPILSVITNISLEHTKMLGNTLAEIAYEKAGIIKANTPVIIGEYHPETFPVFEEVARKNNAPLFLAEEYRDELELGGGYQRKNIGTFLKCIEVINDEMLSPPLAGKLKGMDNISPAGGGIKGGGKMMRRCEDISPAGGGIKWGGKMNKAASAIQNLFQNTGFLGRWQIISKNPLTLCDVAHNPAGIELVMKQLQQLPHNNLHIVLGFVNDKDIDEIIPLLPKEAIYYATQAQIERALPADELFQKLLKAQLKVCKVSNVLKACSEAMQNAQTGDIIFIGGSFFVVGEYLRNIAQK